MWKLLKSLPSAFVVALIVAAIASAAPKPHSHAEEPVVSEAPAPEGSTGPETEPVETEPAPDAGDATSAHTEADGGGGAPDFTPCVGLTGLDNAICRHEQLLLVHPDNEGLANALSHLQDNKAKQDGETGGGSAGGQSGSASAGSANGHVDPSDNGDGHGNSGGNANGHGNSGGNGNGHGNG